MNIRYTPPHKDHWALGHRCTGALCARFRGEDLKGLLGFWPTNSTISVSCYESQIGSQIGVYLWMGLWMRLYDSNRVINYKWDWKKNQYVESRWSKAGMWAWVKTMGSCDSQQNRWDPWGYNYLDGHTPKMIDRRHYAERGRSREDDAQNSPRFGTTWF